MGAGSDTAPVAACDSETVGQSLDEQDGGGSEGAGRPEALTGGAGTAGGSGGARAPRAGGGGGRAEDATATAGHAQEFESSVEDVEDVRRLFARKAIRRIAVLFPVAGPPLATGRGWVNTLQRVAPRLDQLCPNNAMHVSAADLLAEVHATFNDFGLRAHTDGSLALCIRTHGSAQTLGPSGPSLVYFIVPAGSLAVRQPVFEDELSIVAAAVRRRQVLAIRSVAKDQVSKQVPHYPRLFAEDREDESGGGGRAVKGIRTLTAETLDMEEMGLPTWELDGLNLDRLSIVDRVVAEQEPIARQTRELMLETGQCVQPLLQPPPSKLGALLANHRESAAAAVAPLPLRPLSATQHHLFKEHYVEGCVPSAAEVRKIASALLAREKDVKEHYVLINKRQRDLKCKGAKQDAATAAAQACDAAERQDAGENDKDNDGNALNATAAAQPAKKKHLLHEVARTHTSFNNKRHKKMTLD